MPGEPLLLHSLTSFGPLLERCLEAVNPSALCEIGSEAGGTTKLLAEWAAGHGAHVWTVDPQPARDLVDLQAAGAPLTLVAARSPGALAGVPDCEAWIIDGDHNYWTVRAELERATRTPALVVLHDLSWPCARRDQYYDPAALPAEAVHPHSWTGGAVPGVSQLRAGGMRGEGEFAYALEEGGPRNGVRTAVEDVLAERDDLELHVVDAIFGLGIVIPAAAPWADAVRAEVAPHAASPLLTAMERNRLALYLRVIELQDEIAGMAARHAALATEYERRAAADAAELARLRLECARVRA